MKGNKKAKEKKNVNASGTIRNIEEFDKIRTEII
jgi:hypothetical protein